MSLWETRQQSLEYLASQQPSRLAVLERTFELIDDVADAFENSPSRDDYSMVCAIALLKARNLAHGAYGLVLDGLAQEAGALLRPMIEYSELLTYFRLYPTRVSEALDDQLPKAGERARLIRSIYQRFRSHLNEHAAHSSFSKASISHLFNPSTFQLKKTQPFVALVLEGNLRDVVVQLQILLYEAILALEASNPTQYIELGGRYDALKQRMFFVFGLDVT